MPIVTIQVTREGTTPGRTSVSAEEKAALIKGVSELLRDVLNKPLERPSWSSRRSTRTIGAGAACPCPNTAVGVPRRAMPAADPIVLAPAIDLLAASGGGRRRRVS